MNYLYIIFLLLQLMHLVINKYDFISIKEGKKFINLKSMQKYTITYAGITPIILKFKLKNKYSKSSFDLVSIEHENYSPSKDEMENIHHLKIKVDNYNQNGYIILKTEYYKYILSKRCITFTIIPIVNIDELSISILDMDAEGDVFFILKIFSVLSIIGVLLALISYPKYWYFTEYVDTNRNKKKNSNNYNTYKAPEVNHIYIPKS